MTHSSPYHMTHQASVEPAFVFQLGKTLKATLTAESPAKGTALVLEV